MTCGLYALQMKDLYKRVEREAEPLNPVRGVYSLRGRPIDNICQITQGSHVLYTCAGDLNPKPKALKHLFGVKLPEKRVRCTRRSKAAPKSRRRIAWRDPGEVLDA